MLAMKPVHQLQNTIEHLGLPHVDAITENTRTTRTNALMRWLGWNMQYHTAHHAFPGVPCYALPGAARGDLRREPQAADDVLSRLPMGGDARVLERPHRGRLSRRCDLDQRRHRSAAGRAARPSAGRRPEDGAARLPIACGRPSCAAPACRATRSAERFDRVREAAASTAWRSISGPWTSAAARKLVPEFARTGLAGLLTAFPAHRGAAPALHLAKDIGSPFVIVVGQVMPLAVADMAEVVRRGSRFRMRKGCRSSSKRIATASPTTCSRRCCCSTPIPEMRSARTSRITWSTAK
jgi:hypothetical protein